VRGHVACMGMRNAYTNLFGKPDAETMFGRSRRTGEKKTPKNKIERCGLD
jgi:hypothetical protein